MRRMFAAAWLGLLLVVPQLLAGESSPAVRIAVAPKYPSLTLAGRIYGDVTVSVIIDRSGCVEETKVLDGHPMLREAAVLAARQWQFAKGLLPRRKATLTFRFVLLPEDSQLKSQTVFLPPTGFEIREKPAPTSMEDQQAAPGRQEQPISVT